MQLSYADILCGFILALIPFIVPQFEFLNVDTIISATSAIFAIVSGFFIADAMSNYLRLQTLIAQENAALITIAKDVKKATIDAKKAKEIRPVGCAFPRS